jgi:hypothetical protein
MGYHKRRSKSGSRKKLDDETEDVSSNRPEEGCR